MEVKDVYTFSFLVVAFLVHFKYLIVESVPKMRVFSINIIKKKKNDFE